VIIDSFENKEKILLSFLEIAGIEGWNENSLIMAVKRLEIDEKYLSIIFPNQLFSLNEFHVEYFNSLAVRQISSIADFDNLRVRDKIKEIIFLRFYVEKNHRLALKRLLNYYSNPKNFVQFGIGFKPILLALKSCYKIADSSWYAIGDKAVDFNFYSKRFILAKIIMRCFFTFIKDEDDLKKTREIIENNIEKIMIFNKFKQNIKHQVSQQTQDAKHHFESYFINEDLKPKSPKEILKSLPFIRLLKF
jgi:ubiquinone biosynthesis protein COQ9